MNSVRAALTKKVLSIAPAIATYNPSLARAKRASGVPDAS